MILDPDALYNALSRLPVGAAVPPEIYIADYASGERPVWTVVEREPLEDVGHKLVLKDSGNGDLFDQPTVVVLTFPRKTLRTPPQLAGMSGPPVVAEHIKKARYHGRAMDAGAMRIQLARVRRAIARLEEAIEGEYLSGAPAADALHLDDLREPALIDEGGDVLWYVTQAMDALGLTLTDAAERNVEKLSARWPEGFSLEGRADD